MSTAPIACTFKARAARWLLRAIGFIAFSLTVSWLETQVGQVVHSRAKPAGFVIGVVDGALMPIAFPILLAGKDVTIYAVENVGRPYKLGYIIGVTFCGLIFFGLMFSRLGRWRHGPSTRPASTFNLPAENRPQVETRV